MAGWEENPVYPGEHWLYYDRRGRYKARVDYSVWTNGRYMWRVFAGWMGTDKVGFAVSLDAAQQAAEAVMSGETVQIAMF